MQLTNNTILITGGGSGIGRGLAEAFHARGNQVIIAGRNQARLDETVAASPGMHAVRLDITDAADIAGVAAELTARFGDLNVLVNNAGIMQYEDLHAADTASAEATIATNLLGPIRLTAALLNHLKARPHAAVLNVTSGLAFVPLPGTPTYSATKAALHSYTMSLRQQLADTNVDVLELIPPYVQTHLTGDTHATDERAMPLDAYIAATLELLTEQPDETELVIERVAAQRWAERDGQADEIFAFLSALSAERMATT